uniref:Molecular chaperone HtpG n=1 Tax=Candidatus Kentrum sp. UNK TaxID=2126344 RepID=A0A451B3W6_9GAMM|nr:MAG: molecular chaperone HtpG [Candidatus Kentron sp. UNK]VFK72965.1 MAG: molecular chaperone HtpG [Candidatus Kentron sp. UNK]
MAEEKHHTRVGAFVLETLTTGMYRNPLDTLREYIQNAFDAIRMAERQNLIQTGAGRIHVTISQKDRTLTIRDNGVGVATADAATRLVNIGMSAKKLETDAGFRGIGRLAGIAYCDKLVFRTQHHEETTISIVTFDAVALRKAMLPMNRQVEELGKVVDEHVTVTKESTRKKEHFLEVRMSGLNSSGKEFLNVMAVRTYLKQVAPLPFNSQSRFLLKRFDDWRKETGVSLPEVHIVIHDNGNSDELFKPYEKKTYYTAQDKHEVVIEDLCFFPEDARSDSPFWIWYAKTDCPGAIGDDSVAGFRLRRANIAIGPSEERMTDVFRQTVESSARLNRYFIGEVHVQDSSVIPNAHRDDFEETSGWSNIREQLVEFAKERAKDVRFLSDWRNAGTGKIIKTTDKSLEYVKKKQHTGFASKEEQTDLDDQIEKDIVKIEAAARKSDRSEWEQERLGQRLKELQAARESIAEIKLVGKPLNPSLDKNQRKIIRDIRGLLYEVLDKKCYETANAAICKKYQVPEKE